MLKAFGTTRALLLLTLLLLSVSTLAGALFSEDNQNLFKVATSITHVGLVLFGVVFTRAYINNKNRNIT